MAHTVQSMCDGKGVMNIDRRECEGEVSNFRLSGSKNFSNPRTSRQVTQEYETKKA